MIADPERRGRALADLYRELAPRLFAEIEESGALADLDAEARQCAWLEWDCFALYACVRGLVAAGGFNRETAAAIEAFHGAVLAESAAAPAAIEALHDRALEPRGPDAASATGAARAMISERYAEYGAIGQAGGRDDAEAIACALGAAAARHVGGAAPNLAAILSALHESLVEGSAEAVRRATDPA
ncbi:MAG: hypothetical protein HY076_03955 [Candidatus Eisenbacteria bacterium]|uniref:Uncharacterized protein n=1 Tax=Eiseniibacteriota bacterium TaxID=2212470 RepID=A0A9D6QNY9_UNCEI|nr:hypothetical protein [Candidatus Eisenbacteria bacterium]MBI3539409.1 hypothetical protein [Candidatus Eisenbacteria bacterium]